MAKHKTRQEWLHWCRVERDLVGGVTLHVLPDNSTVEIHEGDEFLTVATVVDPFVPLRTPTGRGGSDAVLD